MCSFSRLLAHRPPCRWDIVRVVRPTGLNIQRRLFKYCSHLHLPMAVELVLGLIGGIVLIVFGLFLASRAPVLSPWSLIGSIIMVAGAMTAIYLGTILAVPGSGP